MISIDKITPLIASNTASEVLAHIEKPLHNHNLPGLDFNIEGWVLGNGVVIQQILAFEADNLLYQAYPDRERSDVLAFYRELSQISTPKPGFSIPVNATSLPEEFTIRLIVILEDNKQIRVAELHGHKHNTPHRLKDQAIPSYSEYRVIELVEKIMQYNSWSLYGDLWSRHGFIITPNYWIAKTTRLTIQFSDVPIPQQLAEFQIQEVESQAQAAQQLIELVVPLIETGLYREYFNLWAQAGFHITPVPPPTPDPAFRPNLFLLGAAKSGTTTLYRYLSEIPEICMSNPKEPFFFEVDYNLGLDFYQQRYFSTWQGEPFIGEARHRNLYLPFIPERISAINPHAKLIVILRNPIERSYSHWWHWYSRGIETLEFEAAILEDLKRIEAGYDVTTAREMELYRQTFDSSGRGMYRSYVDSGYYCQQIMRYLHYFPRNQLKIILFDDLKENPYALIHDLEKFIGTDHYTPNNFAPKHENLHMSSDGINHPKAIAPQFRGMLSAHYREHNAALEILIGKRLPSWV